MATRRNKHAIASSFTLRLIIRVMSEKHNISECLNV